MKTVFSYATGPIPVSPAEICASPASQSQESAESTGPEALSAADTGPAVRILIADGQTMFRESLSFLLQLGRGFEVIGTCADLKSVLKLVQSSSPDVLLLDSWIGRPDGVDLLSDLKKLSADVKVVLMCAAPDLEEMIGALRLGVRGIILKSEPADTLVQCIDAVTRGEYWLGKSSVSGLVHALCENGDEKRVRANKYGLTPRESEIVAAVLQGCSNPEIAAELSLSEHTVKHHLSSIFDKLGVYSRLELALFAVNHSNDVP
jgi:two-component system, NarL family, nitrate/nitrite response regulator NarL